LLYILLPFALLARLIGTHVVLELSNLLTVFVAIANCGLLARLIQPRSRIGALVAGGSLALFPGAIFDTHTTKLEPFMLFSFLLSLIFLFPDGQNLSSKRLRLAGLLLGFSACIKIWAAAPIVAVLVVVLLGATFDGKNRFLKFTIIGCVGPVLPFLILAPAQFFHQVFITQLERGPGLIFTIGRGERLKYLASYALGEGTLKAAIISGVLFLMLAVVIRNRKESRALDRIALLTFVVAFIEILLPIEFYSYYSYFPEVFFALLLGCVVALWEEGRAIKDGDRRTDFGHQLVKIAVLGPLLIWSLFSFLDLETYTKNYSAHSSVDVPAKSIDSLIPEGACVTTNWLFFTVDSNRYLSNSKGCPVMVDPYGAWLSQNPKFPPPNPANFVPALTAQWQTSFAKSDYVILASTTQQFVPWSESLRQWFNNHFVRIAVLPNVSVFKQRAQ